MNVMS